MKRYAVWSIVFSPCSLSYTWPRPEPRRKRKPTSTSWMKEEVKLLITSEEESAFKKLKTDEEKDKFIALFWAKRDPSPLDKANEFKDRMVRPLGIRQQDVLQGARSPRGGIRTWAGST